MLRSFSLSGSSFFYYKLTFASSGFLCIRQHLFHIGSCTNHDQKNTDNNLQRFRRYIDQPCTISDQTDGKHANDHTTYTALSTGWAGASQNRHSNNFHLISLGNAGANRGKLGCQEQARKRRAQATDGKYHNFNAGCANA